MAGRKIEMLAGRLASQDAASRTLLGGMTRQLDEIGAQIAQIGDSGDRQNVRLGQSIDALKVNAAGLLREVADGEAQSAALTQRAEALGAALAEVTRQLRDEMPPAMAGIEIQSERTAASAEEVVGKMAAMETAASAAAERVAATEASLGRQREALDALLATLTEGAREAEEKMLALNAAVGEADGAAAQLIRDTGPELVDTLVRVRDAANQAAAHAREAIASVIPDSVANLVEASRTALGEALDEPVKEQIAEIGTASHMALATAKAVLCCQDYYEHLTVGDLKTQTVAQLLAGDTMARLRKWTYGVEEAPADFLCRSCEFALGE